MNFEVEIPFDPETESIYCSFCGSRLEKSGHMFSVHMLCPKHGEFTISPIVMSEKGKWFILTDRTTASMWETCRVVDSRHKDGSPYDPRETRVI
jgi:hypothetical protein